MKSLNFIAIVTLAALLSASCQSSSTATANSAAPSPSSSPAKIVANTAETQKPANSAPPNESKPETAATSNNGASTPTAAYKAAYAARKNKDVKALRGLIAKELFELFEIMGQGKPDAVEAALKQMIETPQGSSDESRNEKINGDKATLEYLDKNDKWTTLDFVKEDGAWKLTLAKPNPEDVKVTRLPEK